MKEQDDIVKGDTCFSAHLRHRSPCPKTQCRHWINSIDTQNCSIIAAGVNKGMTLEQIGKIFNLTRMRVCQIEKNIYKKISSQLAVIR